MDKPIFVHHWSVFLCNSLKRLCSSCKLVCATAARYHVSRPSLYDLAQGFAKAAAEKALVDGVKTIEVCQAFMIMAVNPVPRKSHVEDKSGLYLGVAAQYVNWFDPHCVRNF